MSEFYWDLELFDGTITQIPPEAVEAIKRRWDAGQPIHLAKSGISIPANQIKSFKQSDRRHSDVLLLEESAQAFNSPMYNEQGDALARWVKKTVTRAKWDKFYSATSSYRLLDDNGSLVTIAFVALVHSIDVNVTPYCTLEECAKLEGR